MRNALCFFENLGFAERLLLHSCRCFFSRAAAGGGGARGEEVMVVQGAVEFAADFCGLGAVSGPAALEKDHGHDMSVLRVSV